MPHLKHLIMMGASLLAATIQGEVVIDTLSNIRDDAPSIEGGSGTVPNQELATSFTTPSRALTLTDVTLSIYRRNSGGSVRVRIFSDNGGKPGTSLLTLSGPTDPLPGLPYGTVGNVTYTGTLSLAPNTTYWIDAQLASALSLAYGWSRYVQVFHGNRPGIPAVNNGIGIAGPYAIGKDSTPGYWTVENGVFLASVSAVPSRIDMECAFSVGQHGGVGDIGIPLNLSGEPTSDPRQQVDKIGVCFSSPIMPATEELTPDQVIISSFPAGPIPPYIVEFSQGGNAGQELTVTFAAALPDQHRYRISFEQFVDLDGNPLTGDTDVEFRVLQGDANNSGSVTATDVSFVRSRINQIPAPGESSRADVNMNGSVTATDVSFVRSRIGHFAP